jgi:putative redox protein
MIKAISEQPRYLSKFSNGRGTAFADVSEEQGGTGISFRPHDLLEAALATCINITLRVYAEKHGVPLENVSTTVTLDHTPANQSVFRYEVDLIGSALTEEDRDKLRRIAQSCSVARTLSRPIRFEDVNEPPTGEPVAVRMATTAR